MVFGVDVSIEEVYYVDEHCVEIIIFYIIFITNKIKRSFHGCKIIDKYRSKIEK